MGPTPRPTSVAFGGVVDERPRAHSAPATCAQRRAVTWPSSTQTTARTRGTRPTMATPNIEIVPAKAEADLTTALDAAPGERAANEAEQNRCGQVCGRRSGPSPV